MVKEPSGLGIHPSYAGDTLCPLEKVNRVCAIATVTDNARQQSTRHAELAEPIGFLCAFCVFRVRCPRCVTIGLGEVPA